MKGVTLLLQDWQSCVSPAVTHAAGPRRASFRLEPVQARVEPARCARDTGVYRHATTLVSDATAGGSAISVRSRPPGAARRARSVHAREAAAAPPCRPHADRGRRSPRSEERPTAAPGVAAPRWWPAAPRVEPIHRHVLGRPGNAKCKSGPRCQGFCSPALGIDRSKLCAPSRSPRRGEGARGEGHRRERRLLQYGGTSERGARSDGCG